MYRQGDLLFVPAKDHKINSQQIVADGVLAQGESTGHAHRIAPEDLQQNKARVYFMDQPRRILIEAIESVRVVHEEHKPITLPPGVWEVRQQREYTPEAPRRVFD